MEIPPDLKKDIEVSFLKVVISKLSLVEIKKPEAKKLAQEFLPVIHAKSFEEFNLQINHFSETHPDFKELKLILERFETDKQTNAVLEKMRSHMQTGELDKAISVASEYTQT